MKQRERGLGFPFQPTYRDKKTGERKTAKTWWISFPCHGEQLRENAHTRNRAEAVRLLKEKIGKVGLGQPVGPKLDRTNLDDLLKLVENDYRANGRRSLDRALQASVHVREHFGAHRKARDISTESITAYKARRLEQGAKPSTVNYELAILRRGFRLGRNIVPSRPDFEMLKVDNVRKGFFEPEQYRAVLAHLPDYLKPVATIAHITGWRVKSEILTRQWKHIDVDAGWMRLEPGEGKTREAREFPFTPELRAVLNAQRERVREIQRATGQIVPWVFVHPDGSRIKDFRSSWAKACRAAGVPGRLVHDFRRTAVRNLERAGVPRSAAMKLTGHRTEAVYRRYAITDSAMLQEAAVKLATLHAVQANYQSSDKVATLSGEK
jgi:integrase